MTFKISELKNGTNAYRILELIAISGELPVHLLHRLPCGYDYARAIIGKLKKDGFIRPYSNDKLRGYRLTVKAKRLLLKNDPQKFSFYLTGNTDTNIIRSEYSRRIRLHRLAESYVLMLNADVSVFHDHKDRIPFFHSSREIKENYRETLKIKGSRMMGVLETDDDIFVVYNIGTSFPKWNYQSELRVKVYVRNDRHKTPTGIIISHGFDQFIRVFKTADSGERCFFLLDNSYEHFYYLTQSRYGEVLIRMLCDRYKLSALNSILSQGYMPADKSCSIENDAMDTGGNPVLFGYLMDIPRINRFFTALNLRCKSGTVICFDFQQKAFEQICSERVEVKAISFDKFNRRFFECEEK